MQGNPEVCGCAWKEKEVCGFIYSKQNLKIFDATVIENDSHFCFFFVWEKSDQNMQKIFDFLPPSIPQFFLFQGPVS